MKWTIFILMIATLNHVFCEWKQENYLGCTPDDCTDQWETDTLKNQLIDSVDCQGCYLNIFYKHRKTCGNWQDLQILGIEKHNPNTTLFTCGCTAEEIYKLAVEMAIKQNDMGFEPIFDDNPNTDSCSVQWRVSQISCWTNWNYNPPLEERIKGKNPKTQDIDPNMLYQGWTIYQPCDSSSCCARQVKVCRQGLHEATVEDMGMLVDEGDCDTTYSPHDSVTICYNTCDFLENIHSAKLPDFNDNEILEIKETINDGKILVYYNNDILKILFDNINTSEGEISIYNITGKLLISKTENLYSGRSKLEIDISKLNSGIYIFRISLDGMIVKNGKINLTR